MPRFYFDVRDGGDNPDLDGTLLNGIKEVRQEGLRFVARLLAEEPMRLALGQNWELVVRDDAANVVLRIAVNDG